MRLYGYTVAMQQKANVDGGWVGESDFAVVPRESRRKLGLGPGPWGGTQRRYI